MINKSPKKATLKVPETRNDRLKSALKANLAKRKKQALNRAHAKGGDQKRDAKAKAK